MAFLGRLHRNSKSSLVTLAGKWEHTRFMGTRIRIPPYIERNTTEKNMDRLPGISQCPDNCLCSQNIEVSYKNYRLLSQFTSQQTGCILPRAITKVCIKKQIAIAKEIKRARGFGFLPSTYSLPEFHSDPRLFNRNRDFANTLSRIRSAKDREKTLLRF